MGSDPQSYLQDTHDRMRDQFFREFSAQGSMAMRSLREWHQRFGVPAISAPSFPGPIRATLRVKLIEEEAEEFRAASESGDVVEAADAIGDLLYVVYGAALEWGIDADAVFAEVHRSNMTKVWPDGTVHYREDGKVIKPPTYSKADIKGVVGL